MTRSIVIVALLSLASPLISDDVPAGSLDSTFGTGGTVVTDLNSSGFLARDLVIQPHDDKILSVGGYLTKLLVSRHTKSGMLDSTFGNNGVLISQVGPSVDDPKEACVQHDGRILVTGSTLRYNDGSSHGDLFVVRLNTNGTLDESFGNGGKFFFNLGTQFTGGHDITLQPDGKIVVAGYSGNQSDFRTIVIRLNPNGTLDASFATAGSFLYPQNNLSGESWAFSVKVRNDEKILVVGSGGDYSINSHVFMMRLTKDGVFDSTFNSGGYFETGFGSRNSNGASKILIRPNDKIALAGWAEYPGEADFALLQRDPDGTKDYTFGGEGDVTLDFHDLNYREFLEDAVIGEEGTIVAGGTVGRIKSNHYTFGLAQFLENGALDNSFGENGRVIIDYGAVNSFLGGIAFQSDGRLIVGGSTGVRSASFDGIALARVLVKPGRPDISVQGSLRFGKTVLRRKSRAKPVTIENGGTANLNGVTLKPSGGNFKDFRLSGPRNTTITPGTTERYFVVFRPSKVGKRTSSLLIQNSSSLPSFTIQMEGTGRAR